MSEEKTIPVKKIELEIPVEVYDFFSTTTGKNEQDIDTFLLLEFHDVLRANLDQFVATEGMNERIKHLDNLLRHKEDQITIIEIKVSPEEYQELSSYAKFRDRSIGDLALTLMRLDLKGNKWQMEGKTFSEAFPDL